MIFLSKILGGMLELNFLRHFTKVAIGPINEIEIQKWPMVPLLRLPRAHLRHFSIFYINFYIAYQWKSQKWPKRGHFLIYFYSGIFFLVKLPKIDAFLLRLVVFDKICAFQRGVKIQDFANFSDFWGFWPLSEMNIFRQKRPNATKIH